MMMMMMNRMMMTMILMIIIFLLYENQGLDFYQFLSEMSNKEGTGQIAVSAVKSTAGKRLSSGTQGQPESLRV
jgi:hypothetical protein